VKARARSALWWCGWPARASLVAMIRIYRWTLAGVLGGRCRFHPTCSEYAELAVRERGAARGAVLTAWRIMRCSPLSAGGVDYPPGVVYDSTIQAGDNGSSAASDGVVAP